jgi:hypothetical protein
VADVGEYQLTINALGNCLSRTVKQMIGHHCTNLLPLTFEKFDVIASSHQLNWTVRDAFGVTEFVIERSLDGENWMAAGSVIAKLTESDTQQYQFADAAFATGNNTVVHYRIKAVNAENTARYSPVRNIIKHTGFKVTKMYPNPFRQAINIEFVSDAAGQAVIMLHDASGKEAARTVMPVLKGLNTYQYKPQNNLEAGYYFVTLLQGNNRHTQKILKANN